MTDFWGVTLKLETRRVLLWKKEAALQMIKAGTRERRGTRVGTRERRGDKGKVPGATIPAW